MNKTQAKKIEVLSKVKLPQDARTLLNKIEKALQGGNSDAKEKANTALDNLFNKVKEVAAKQQSEDKGEKVSPKTVTPKSSDIDEPEQKEEISKVANAVVDPLMEAINNDASLKGFNPKATDVLRDSSRPAMSRGRRVSRKGWKNQYGESAGGRVYYETRENRMDRKAPISKNTKMPWLEHGGHLEGDGFEVVEIMDGNETIILSNQSLNDAKVVAMAKRHMGDNGDYLVRDSMGNIFYSSNPSMFKVGGYMEHGGLVGEKFTISSMREKLGSMFPDSFGFTVGTISPEGNKSVNSSALITNPNDPFRGLKDEDINSKLFFPQYKKLHDIRFRIYQGGENTYFYFNLESTNGDEYVGQFGFKDKGDVPSSYITRFIAFLMEQYGLPFEVNHSVMAKGGMTDHNLMVGDKIRQGFDNMIEVENDGKTYLININTGQRWTLREWQSLNGVEMSKYTKMAEGGELRNYKTYVQEYPDGKIYVRVKFSGVDKDVQNYVANEANKTKAINFAKRLAEKNNGTYEGFKNFSMAKGGVVYTDLNDIPNLMDRVERGYVTYRGLGAFKEGTEITVDGKKYIVTDEDFRTIARDKDGNMRIRFAAPSRKRYEDGGVNDEEYTFLTNEDFQKISDRVEKDYKDQDKTYGLYEKFTKYWYSGGREKAIDMYGDDEQIAWQEAYEDFKDDFYDKKRKEIDSFEDGGYMAKGGSIKNQYEGRDPEDVWNNLSIDQRQHFIYDHADQIEELKGKELTSMEIKNAYNSKWIGLDPWIKNRFENHVREGQYAKGGTIKKGDRVRSTVFKDEEGEVINKKGDMLFVRKEVNGQSQHDVFRVNEVEKLAMGGELTKVDVKLFEKGDKIKISYGSSISRNNEVTLMVKNITLVNKGKSNEKEKITFINLDNPTGVKYYAYISTNSDYVGFAVGDMAISNVKLINKFEDGGSLGDSKYLARMAEEYAEREYEKPVKKGNSTALAGKLPNGKLYYKEITVYFKDGTTHTFMQEDFEEFFDVDDYAKGGELQKGIRVEMKEHGMSRAKATKTALDHLKENPKYYTKMEEAGLESGGEVEFFDYSNADLDKLPVGLTKYFNKPKGTITIEMSKIVPTRAREKGVKNANKYMLQAYKGEIEKRDPIKVYKQKGKYYVQDGNSTYANAKFSGWKTIYATVVKNPKLVEVSKNRQGNVLSLAKEIRQVGESWQDAIQRAKKMNK